MKRGELDRRSTDDNQINAMDKETITFTGYGRKVAFVQFDQHIARNMHIKYGRNIGERLWMENYRSWRELERYEHGTKAPCLKL